MKDSFMKDNRIYDSYLDADMDKEVLPLVRAMNKIKNVKTNSSCSGHEDGDKAYVVFETDFDTVLEILKCIQFYKFQSKLLQGDLNAYVWVSIHIKTVSNGNFLEITEECEYVLNIYHKKILDVHETCDDVARRLSEGF